MILMRTAARFSQKLHGKVVVLLRTAARFSQKYFFKKHPSVLPGTFTRGPFSFEDEDLESSPEGCFLKKYFLENLAAVLRRTATLPGNFWENCSAVLMRTNVEISY